MRLWIIVDSDTTGSALAMVTQTRKLRNGNKRGSILPPPLFQQQKMRSTTKERQHVTYACVGVDLWETREMLADLLKVGQRCLLLLHNRHHATQRRALSTKK